MKTICRKQAVHTLFGLVWMGLYGWQSLWLNSTIFCLENLGKYKDTVDKICKTEK